MGLIDRETAWASQLSPKDKRGYIKVALDEIDATMTLVKKGISKANMRDAKRWVMLHKRRLKLLGYNKRVKVKFPKVEEKV